MTYKTLKFKKTENLQDFCNVWALLYTDFERDKTHYKPAIDSKIISRDLLLRYFEWKNGSKLSQLKEKSLKEKVEPKLSEINSLRNCKTSDFQLIREVFSKLSDIWLITLAHLINPEYFPVFDQHVYRAYKFLTCDETEIPEYNKENQRINLYLEDYLPFFKRLVASDDNINKKKLDEALWGFGKFIGKNNSILDI